MQTELQNKLTTHSSIQIQHSLRDFLNILFQHQSKITIFFLLYLLLFVLVLTLRMIYKSYAKLLIRAGRLSVSIDPSGTGWINVSQNLIDEVNPMVSKYLPKNAEYATYKGKSTKFNLKQKIKPTPPLQD